MPSGTASALASISSRSTPAADAASCAWRSMDYCARMRELENDEGIHEFQPVPVFEYRLHTLPPRSRP